MITIILLAIHVILSLALILIVLLQTSKGSDLASAFGGGGANAVFGGAGPTSFLNKMTTAVAVLFMVTSISLAYMGTSSSTVMPKQRPEPISDVQDTEGLEALETEGLEAEEGEPETQISEEESALALAEEEVVPAGDHVSDSEDAPAEQPLDQADEAAAEPIEDTE